MEYFLARSLTIRQEEVHAFAPNARLWQDSKQLLSHFVHPLPGIAGNVLKAGVVFVGDHQHMACVDRLNVHERRTKLVAMDKARLSMAS